MVWAILAAVGVPLWLCAIGILSLVVRNRSLRKRAGDIPVRMRAAPGRRWRRGHAVWVRDVFVFRGSPAAWNEALLPITALTTRVAEPKQPRGLKGLHKLGEHPVVASLFVEDGEVVEFAARPENAELLSGPFGTAPGDLTSAEHAAA